MKIGDLVMKALGSNARADAGLGLVVEILEKPGLGMAGSGCKVQWSNDYGTYWASEDKLERVNENR